MKRMRRVRRRRVYSRWRTRPTSATTAHSPAVRSPGGRAGATIPGPGGGGRLRTDGRLSVCRIVLPSPTEIDTFAQSEGPLTEGSHWSQDPRPLTRDPSMSTSARPTNGPSPKSFRWLFEEWEVEGRHLKFSGQQLRKPGNRGNPRADLGMPHFVFLSFVSTHRFVGIFFLFKQSNPLWPSFSEHANSNSGGSLKNSQKRT